MRALVVVAASLLPLALAAAQQRDSTGRDSTRRDSSASAGVTRQPPPGGVLARDVANEVVEAYNAPQTMRVHGSLDVAQGQEIDGDVAVLEGTVTVAGHVRGRVYAINSDIVLKPSAQIDGDVVVVGGIVQGRTEGYVGGDIRVYRQALYYEESGDRIALSRTDEGAEADERWWNRWRNRSARSRGDITLSSAHTYNRVEGLPVYLGPTFRRETAWGRASVQALGILRSVNTFHWDSKNVGHRAKGELRFGGRSGLALGGVLYDTVSAVEPWQLTDAEVGLASFFFHRDYRDYFDRHGGSAFATIFAGPDATLALSLSDERWGARDVRDPFTLFHNGADWRANPGLDNGRMHVANVTLRIDTRNDVDNPWAGWYFVADYEHGSGDLTSLGSRSVYGPVLQLAQGTSAAAAPATPTTYSRGFVDLRRYNRVAPDAQLNLRLVVGGALSREELPLERRLSVGGPGTLAGYDFRGLRSGTDVLQCSGGEADVPLGVPAQCDRIALAQAEYRSDLRFSFNSDDDEEHHDRWRWWHFGVRTEASWVVFADAGRGWLLKGAHPNASAMPNDLAYGFSTLPPLSTFRTDLGVGIDFAPVGFYVAKSVSDAKEPANFLVRVRKRF